MTVPTTTTVDGNTKTWNEMIYLSTFTFLRYMPWNVEALSIHFHCNWSDHTAIEIVSCGTSLSGICCCYFAVYISKRDCFILLITCPLIDTSLTFLESCVFPPRTSPLGSFAYAREAMFHIFLLRWSMNISLIKN
jgi:hypothetical protein